MGAAPLQRSGNGHLESNVGFAGPRAEGRGQKSRGTDSLAPARRRRRPFQHREFFKSRNARARWRPHRRNAQVDCFRSRERLARIPEFRRLPQVEDQSRQVREQGRGNWRRKARVQKTEMKYRLLATDYDGTIAHHGAVAPSTVAALQRFKDSGRKVILVTGREIPDLESVFSETAIFDLIVAEN